MTELVEQGVDASSSSSDEHYLLEHGPCEWTTFSYYQAKLCSRDAVKNDFGPSFCWQHADAAFAFVVNHLQKGHYQERPIEELAKAILDSGRFKPNGSSDRHPDIATFVQEQIIEYLEWLADDGECYLHKARETWWRRGGLYNIDRLIDQLLEKRIKEKWGTD